MFTDSLHKSRIARSSQLCFFCKGMNKGQSRETNCTKSDIRLDMINQLTDWNRTTHSHLHRQTGSHFPAMQCTVHSVHAMMQHEEVVATDLLMGDLQVGDEEIDKLGEDWRQQFLEVAALTKSTDEFKHSKYGSLLTHWLSTQTIIFTIYHRYQVPVGSKVIGVLY